MKKNLLILFYLVFFIEMYSQNYTLYGNIIDKVNGEHLIGATIYVDNNKFGTVSNNYGFYSLTLPNGDFNVTFSFIGYNSITYNLNLSKDTVLNIELNPNNSKIDEVIVLADKNNIISNTETGSWVMDIKTIKSIPATAGEVDIIKSLQLLPGIQTSHEGTTNISIRGGSFDQNLFLLDDAPVYNPSHALGFFSTFNPDAIKNVKVFKSNFPAQYGGKISSVVDIHMKEGNNKEFKISGGLGLISSRLTIEAPIIKQKASFIVSGRYSYAGLTANTLGTLGQEIGMRSLKNFNNKNEINFYDLNTKLNFKVNSKNHLFLSTYTGRDHFFYYAIDDNSSMNWGNIISTARWNHIYNSKLFSHTMLIFSKYDYSYILKDDARHFKWLAYMQELDFKTDFDFFINPANHLKFGFSIENHNYFPGKVEPRDTSSITKALELENKRAIINSVYIQNEQKLNKNISISYGLRYSGFFLLGEGIVNKYSTDFNILDSIKFGKNEIIQFYQGLEPRFLVRYLFNSKNSIKISYARTKQYQHLVSNSSVGLPTDVWLPADKYIEPQMSNQFTIGYYKTFEDTKYDFFTELYYKKLNKIIDYKDNADLFLNPQIETQILTGKGESFGAEFLIEKKVGKLTGWISYTISKTFNQINGINNNEPYPVKYDKKHNISTALSYNLSASWVISSTFKYTSGGYITIPEGTFNYYGASFNYYTKKNGFQLPAYHRLDVAVYYRNKKNDHRKWQTEWIFGINNIYGRKNLFTLFIKQDVADLNASKAYKMYLYGMIPFLTFNFSF